MPVHGKKDIKSSPREASRKRRSLGTVSLKHLANVAGTRALSKTKSEAIVGGMIDLIVKHLKKGDRIRIGSLGILEVRERARHVILNPAGGVARKKASAAMRPNVHDDTRSAYEPAPSAHEPSARARALLRGKEIAEKDLRDAGGSYPLRDVATLLGISRQAIDKKVRDDALLAIPGPHGRRRYPVVQFTADGILPGLQEVLRSLPSTNAWFRLNFLVTPDSRLGGRPPIDLLKEGRIDPAVKAARAIGTQGA